MNDYISYVDIPQFWNLKRGDVVFISSDITDLFISCKRHGELFDANKFIDAIIDVIGPAGTLLFPTYNWEFCKGKAYDYSKTSCKTGYLGTVALSRKDFKRTKHPIYSFAVTGKDKSYLCELDNRSSFGADSPFAYLDQHNAKNVFVGISYANSFTYPHYIQEQTNLRDCRYMKTFAGDYIDEYGVRTQREYTMLVRDLSLNVENNISPLGLELDESGVTQLVNINDLEYRILDLHASNMYIERDILYNRSRKICKFIGQ